MCNDYKDRCSDCCCLVEKDGKWYCDEAQEFCEKVDECPEGIQKCEWCEEYFCDSELHRETHLGMLCDRCISAIQSRGEKLTIEI